MTEQDPATPDAAEPVAPEPEAPAVVTPPYSPAEVAPQTADVWEPPAPAAWQPVVPRSRPRPALLTTASIVLIVFGTFTSLIGVLFVLGGALIGTVADRPDLGIDLSQISTAVGGILAVLGAFVLLFGVLQLLSGIFALLGRAWARILAIVTSVLGGLFGLLGVLGVRGPEGGVPATSVVLLLAYIFVVWAMAVSGPFFADS